MTMFDAKRWVLLGVIVFLLLGPSVVVAESIKLTIDTYPNLVFEVVYPETMEKDQVVADLDAVEQILGREMTKVAIEAENSGALYASPDKEEGKIVYQLPLGEIVSIFAGYASEVEFKVTIDTAIGWELSGVDPEEFEYDLETKGTLDHYLFTGSTKDQWPTLRVEYAVPGTGLFFYVVQLLLLWLAAPLVMFYGGTYVVNLVLNKQIQEDLRRLITLVSVASTLTEIGIIYLGFRIWHWIQVGTFFLGFAGAFLLSMGSVLVSMILLMVAGYQVEKRARKTGVL